MTDSSSTSTEGGSGAAPVRAGLAARGRLRPPASKSLTQRWYNLALLANGPTTVELPLRSEDCDHFLGGLRAVGCLVDDRGESVTLRPPTAPGRATLDCGASGTMLRLLTASLCAVPGRWRLDGVPRLRERPLAPLVDALRRLGGRVTCLGEPGFAPVEIEGGALRGGRVALDGSESSQFLSALLMAGAAAERATVIAVRDLVSRPYVDLTRAVLGELGVSVASGAVEDGAGIEEWSVVPSRPAGAGVTVEADASAACYPAAAAALTDGDVTLLGLRRDSPQGDLGLLDLLRTMGAGVDWSEEGARVRGGELRAVDADLAQMPDQVPTLAALAPFARGTTVIRNVAHLRLKESDRLAAMARELGRLGARVTERGDGLEIDGCWADGATPSTPIVVDTHDDHRIAMSCALVGLRRSGVRIGRPEVVAKSYPDFWRDLRALGG